MQSLTFIIFIVSEKNRNVKVFATYRQSAGLTLLITCELKRVGRKACKHLPGVGMRLYAKSEVDACINVSVMSGQTDRQTDKHISSYTQLVKSVV